MTIYEMYLELSKVNNVVLINPETKEIFMNESEIPVDFASEPEYMGEWKEL